MRPTNWLGAENPWNLPAPPDWWLRRLAERDPALRILPGLTEACYRVGRLSPTMRTVTPILGNDSETGRMCREGLIPVVTLRPGVTWNADFFGWLDANDTWRYGGPDRYVDRLEAEERETAAQAQRASDDENDARGTSAYFAQLVRRGALAFVQTPDSSTG